MNIYNDDVVFLSEESAEALVSSLLFDKEALSLRDDFIADIEQNISILDNGSSIIVEVPEIELIDGENYSQVKAAVNTKEISICVNVAATMSAYYLNTDMQNYNQAINNSNSKYIVAKKIQSDEWNTSTEVFYEVA